MRVPWAVVAWLVAGAALSLPSSVRADEPARAGSEPSPPRWIATLTAGTSVRVNPQPVFQQRRLAPAYVDLLGAYVWPSRGRWRHAFGLGASLNLTADGTFSIGVDEAEQLVLTPTYGGYLPLIGWEVPRLVGLVRVGLPLAVTPETSPGLELALGMAYMWRAGLGVYAEVGGSAFLGARAPGDIPPSVHGLVSAELGVMLDYEVLP